jgi:hypothetical protein
MTAARVCAIALLALVACQPTPKQSTRVVTAAPPASGPVAVAPPPASETASESTSEPPDVAPVASASGPEYPPVVGEGVIERGRGPNRRADTQGACRACKGSWGPHGITGQVGCICGTFDAGKPCTSPRDCEAECMVDNPDAYRDVRCGPSGCNGPEIAGHCAAYTVSFGCHSRVAEMPYQGGYVREVHTICLD